MKISTMIEKSYRKVGENLYQEVTTHYLTFIDPATKSMTKKIDRVVEGRLYKEDTEARSTDGEVFHYFEQDGQTRRLIAIKL